MTNETLKPFQYEVPLRFGALYPGQNHKVESSKLENGLDCVVTTIERMQHRRDGDKFFISNVETLIIDEFDTFVDSGHQDNIKKLLD